MNKILLISIEMIIIKPIHFHGMRLMFSARKDLSADKKIVTDIFANTLSENEEVIESEELNAFCERAYHLEKNIYHLDPAKFGITEFKKAFLGTNKLKSHPDDKPLPYDPLDIKIFNNSIFIFKDMKKAGDNKDVGYFTALCFFKKNGAEIESIHIRFLAGMDEQYRGLGFHYLPIFRHVFGILQKFSEKYPDQNPTVNITQFAMVSAGTPGAIKNFASIISKILGRHVPEINYGDQEAIKIATMFGLRDLLDSFTGKADINMKVKVATLYQNKNNKGANDYDSLNLKEGEGIAGRQALGNLKNLLAAKNSIDLALHAYEKSKSANILRQSYSVARL